MLAWIFLLFLQLPIERAILEVEDSRSEDISVLVQALKSPEARTQRLAMRALGRMERPAHTDLVVPFLSAPDPDLRKEAANALGQTGARVAFLISALEKEKDGGVRGVLYETMGRLPGADEQLLLKGLEEKDVNARIGAAKGLEACFRLNSKTARPSLQTIQALRAAIQRDNSTPLRELALLILNAAGDSDPATLTAALTDSNPLVRRLAVMGSKQWREDPSYLVRFEALKVSASCERAAAAVADPSDHVALLAIDLLGNGCSSAVLEHLVDQSRDWRRQAHALVSLAKVNPGAAEQRLDRLSRCPVWQARVYAAKAARILKSNATLARLLRDQHPNVVAAALVEPPDAVTALQSPHYGLIMRATECLKGWKDGSKAVPALMSALKRITVERRATSRDPRRAIMERLREFGGSSLAEELKPWLSDFDPAIAQLAAQIITQKGGSQVFPQTRRFAVAPVPPQNIIDGLKGARARFQMQEGGAFTLVLLPEEAPVTVATFVRLAESGYYTNLTFHRIVPNFVIQGGSPGADEYVGASDYLRDELGLLSHSRGTVGISTRGRDTGDSQIFINLVDNFRLDHNYTVFARVVEGMDNVDRIQEGDSIQSIQIIRTGLGRR